MRQLSTRVRWAAVTALTIAAATGCVSVGDDTEKPSPARSADEKGVPARSDGAPDSGGGRSGSGGGRAEAQSEREGSRRPDAKASGRTPSAGAEDARPAPAGPGTPQPTLAPPHTPEPSAPGPGEPPPPAVSEEPPAPSSEPEPSQPPEPPSASPAAQFRNDAAGVPGRGGVWPTPRVSPQVAPV
ncbi:hypothetical protein AB0D35_26760 [Streptomyces sp. NPDC048301]|uniref:hypothetical protein n=1 Tax=unclassified Streptomyces TaxID=2593676 RepID=UPI00341C5B98